MMGKGSSEQGRENVVSLTCHSLPPLFSHLSEKHTQKNCKPCRLKLPKTSSRNTSFYIFIFIFICLLFSKWPLCMITSDEQISPPSSSFLNIILCICTLCAWVFFSNVLPWKFIDMQNMHSYILKTILGGEIYSFDVNMHKGYCLVVCTPALPPTVILKIVDSINHLISFQGV